MKKTSESLSDVRDVLTRDGWCKGALHDTAGSHCIYGAFQSANLFNQGHWNKSVTEVHNKVVESGFLSILKFNDDERTTMQDVLNIFDKAIASAEERGD